MILTLAALASALAALVLPRPTRSRVWGFLAFAALGLAASADRMGEPKPLWVEWRDLGDVTVLHVWPDPGRAIYLWVYAGGPAPRAYALPWDEDRYRELNVAMLVAEGMNEDGVRLDLGDGPLTWYGYDPDFAHESPVRAAPRKPAPTLVPSPDLPPEGRQGRRPGGT